MHTRTLALVTTFLLGGAVFPLDAQDPSTVREVPTGRAELRDQDGRYVGEVLLRQTPQHGVLVRIQVEGLEAGTHAVHIHETGVCEAPAYESAGGHYAPRGRAHGVLHAEGYHAGDLLNLVVPEDGRAETEQLATGVTLLEGVPGTLFDEDGSAFIVHADADDYRSQPAGAAGDRIACGVIRPNGERFER